jgi:Trypsin-like peptidase domain
MAMGRILADGKDKGSGFALASRVAVTANHVVRRQAAESLHFALGNDRTVAVDRVEGDETLDVAVLHLREKVAEVLAVGHATEGGYWRVEAQPQGNDPLLTGTIDAARRRLVNDKGHQTEVVQLRVDQELGDYKGYSGSAVALQSPRGVVVGVLVEQLRWRLPSPAGQPRPAANVLYAIPIQAILDRFGLADPHPDLAGLSPEQVLLLRESVETFVEFIEQCSIVADAPVGFPAEKTLTVSLWMLLTKVERQLKALTSVRVDTWPDTTWATNLGPVRLKAQQELPEPIRPHALELGRTGTSFQVDRARELRNRLRELQTLITERYPSIAGDVIPPTRSTPV